MGVKQNSTNAIVLNNTLKEIAVRINEKSIDNWFISYGTLLGIIRNGSCIDHDDDIDINVDHNDYDTIKNLLVDWGFEIWNETYPYDKSIKNTTRIIKTKPKDGVASIDFYFCDVDKQTGDFYDPWNGVIWVNCMKDGELLKKKWSDTIVKIPNNYERKLEDRYGSWRTPKNVKTGGSSPKYLH